MCAGLFASDGFTGGESAAKQGRPEGPRPSVSAEDDALLEDLSKRSFLFFWEQADPDTGIVRDRARTDGTPVTGTSRDVGSIASVGFGLTGLCIAAERGWVPRRAAVDRARTTLRFFARANGAPARLVLPLRQPPHRCSRVGQRAVLHRHGTAPRGRADGPPVLRRRGGDRQPRRVIYRRVDFTWMLAGDPLLLSHGWKPETGFLESRWDHYCELTILYLLAIGSPTHPIPPASWRAWRRPTVTFDGHSFIGGPPPLFVHQFSHAWVDFRGWREREPPHTDWWQNSVEATRAHKAFCLKLSGEFPGYTEHMWGITSSDSRRGYVAWGGPPRHEAIDGTVVPCAAAGSLMLAPDITLPAVREMRRRFGDRIYGRYGFADAFHPMDGWVNPDVIGIDLGITLLSAENLRSGRVWELFMRNAEIPAAMERVGMTRRVAPAAAVQRFGPPRRRPEGRSRVCSLPPASHPPPLTRHGEATLETPFRAVPHPHLEHARFDDEAHVAVVEPELRGVSTNSTCRVAPGSSDTRAKPFSSRTGRVTVDATSWM